MRIIKNLDEKLLSGNEDILDAALEAAAWIEDSEIRTENGIRWKQCPERKTDPDDEILFQPYSFYGGSSGVAFFMLRLYLVTKDEKWLDKAVRAADEIAASYKRDDFETSTGYFGLGMDTGFFNGASGQAYFAENLYLILKEKDPAAASKYHAFALKAADDIVQAQIVLAAKDGGEAGTWTKTLGILGDEGLTLFLMFMYETSGNKEYLDAAQRAANYLADNAERTEHGIRWYTMDTQALGFGVKAYSPNFEYGSAGNAYVLAVLYKLTGNEKYLGLAKEALEYTESTAAAAGNGVLLPYFVPVFNDLYYLGICHGPAGVSRTYRLMYELSGDDHYREYAAKLTEGILSTGAPQIHSPGYWHNYCFCCGAAGLLEHFVKAGSFLKTDKYTKAAFDCADVLIGDSVADSGKRRWYSAWTRVKPKEVEAYTGFYPGGAGCASALLTLYNETHGKLALPGCLEDFWA